MALSRLWQKADWWIAGVREQRPSKAAVKSVTCSTNVHSTWLERQKPVPIPQRSGDTQRLSTLQSALCSLFTVYRAFRRNSRRRWRICEGKQARNCAVLLHNSALALFRSARFLRHDVHTGFGCAVSSVVRTNTLLTERQLQALAHYTALSLRLCPLVYSAHSYLHCCVCKHVRVHSHNGKVLFGNSSSSAFTHRNQVRFTL